MGRYNMEKHIKVLKCGCIEDTLNVGIIKHCPKHEQEWLNWVTTKCKTTYC
jgi:hypothetical protein